MLFSPFIIGIALMIVMASGSLYVNVVQKNACYAYARQKNLPHLEFLVTAQTLKVFLDEFGN
jgi:hypothetical protein